MKNIEFIISKVNNFYDNIDKQILDFKKKYKLNCLPGCGYCCSTKDIHSTILEFLPLAKYLWESDKINETIEKISCSKTICIFNSDIKNENTNWKCSIYPYRGFLCRIFGFMAVRNKFAIPLFQTCKEIKFAFSEEFQTALKIKNIEYYLPIIPDTTIQFINIEPDLATIQYPINLAIRYAIDTIVNFYRYDLPILFSLKMKKKINNHL